ncbi:phage minor head protein [Pseudoalteromonas piscicida]|uniref:Phage head morphogenesis protein n=1 Tax=Pseudoalteromonas piscicida TaxID=43662 RepID=A0AAD0RN87_PSEO7|nr:phage minor head protein [Pseudoalteromonas piscicida]ASD67713.1 phage head morphogenesis protein [Pseudoalteromonas piscicida]AXR01583.1 phage head morphogenesis protein [Pseudoalteromonas piscicida]
MIDLSIAFNKPPADAVAYFKSKGYAISDEWHDVLTTAHAKAFTVARVQSMEVLEAIRKYTDTALAEGLTAKQFREQLTPELQRLGWWGKTKNEQGDSVQLGSPYRLNNIYRTNLQTAYMSGRYRRMLARSKTHPYWQYVAIDDAQTRPEHKLLHGKVFRFDDPIWQIIYPPNGWGCRCRVRALTEAQVKARGLTVEDGSGYVQQFDAEIVSRESGEVKTTEHARVKLPSGDVMTPDVGWAYSPGQSAFGTDVAVAQKLGKVESTQLRAETIQALNNSDERAKAFELWTRKSVERIERFQAAKHAGDKAGLKANGPRPQHKTVVSFLSDDINQKLQDKGIDAARTLILSERALAHAHSEKHKASGQALELSEYINLSKWINQSGASVLWEPERSEVLYVINQGEQAIKVIVRFDSNSDTLINVFKVDSGDIEGGIKGGNYEVWR